MNNSKTVNYQTNLHVDKVIFKVRDVGNYV